MRLKACWPRARPPAARAEGTGLASPEALLAPAAHDALARLWRALAVCASGMLAVLRRALAELLCQHGCGGARARLVESGVADVLLWRKLCCVLLRELLPSVCLSLLGQLSVCVCVHGPIAPIKLAP